MGFIFNRNVLEPNGSNYDGYDTALASWENSSDLEENAMAMNLKYDHRVSDNREIHFRDIYFEPERDLLKALKDHAAAEIKFRADPEFCRSYCLNFIADFNDQDGLICEQVSQTTELTTVVNLNGLSTPFIDTYPYISDLFLDFEDVDKRPDYIVKTKIIKTKDGEKQVKKTGFDDWLDTRLEGKSIDEIESFLLRFFELLKYRFESNKFYHPVWVTKWSDFKQYTNASRDDGTLDIDRWNQVVGVPTELDKWQIVLKYPASEVDCLYRPTVLDGGCKYPQHFPSPPNEAIQMGGLTMDLGIPDRKLLPEFIHKQIEIKPEFWTNAGRLIGKTQVEGYTVKLPVNRNNHHTKLKDKFSAPIIEGWMTKAI